MLIIHSTNPLSLSLSLSHCFVNQIPFSLSLEMKQEEILVFEILLRILFLDSQCQFRSGYRFKPIWGDHKRRTNFANSKPQSHPQIPILNLKRKRDFGFRLELPANAKPHLDVGSDLDENPKPYKIKRLKIIPPKKLLLCYSHSVLF